MIINYFRARRVAALDSKYRCAALDTRAPRTVSSILVTLRHAMTIMGISAICTLGIMFVNPDIADQLLAYSPFADKVTADQKAELAQLSAIVQAPEKTASTAEEKTEAELEADAESQIADKVMLGTRGQQKLVTQWLAKRYRVASDAANMLVTAAYLTAHENKMDPLLILSVIAVESRFNPFAESPVGAQGLMQVMSKIHKERFDDHGGVKAALNPVTNIKVGSQILKEYVKRGGSVEAGLKSYVGAANMPTDSGYGAKVLSEYRKLKEVAHGKRMPTTASKVAHTKRSLTNDDGAQSTTSALQDKKEVTVTAAESKLAKL